MNDEYCGGECHGDCDVEPTPCRDPKVLLKYIEQLKAEKVEYQGALVDQAKRIFDLKADLSLEKESSSRNDANSFDQIRGLSERAEKAEAERDRLRVVFKEAKNETKNHLKKHQPDCVFERCELCRSVAAFEALNHKEV